MYFREDCLSPERSEVEFRSDGKKPGAGGRVKIVHPSGLATKGIVIQFNLQATSTMPPNLSAKFSGCPKTEPSSVGVPKLNPASKVIGIQ
jgi:hypothetical protein